MFREPKMNEITKLTYGNIVSLVIDRRQKWRGNNHRNGMKMEFKEFLFVTRVVMGINLKIEK
jgi:hypothetical protein